jgi:hypothetical protein
MIFKEECGDERESSGQVFVVDGDRQTLTLGKYRYV